MPTNPTGREPAKNTARSGGFAVLVFDMAHTGDEDGEHRVDGFATLDDAREYARRRTRASVEELRRSGIDPAELRELWSLFGEDCSVLGDGYRGSSELDRFIAEPAAPADCDWPALVPPRPLRRFYVAALIGDGDGDSVLVGGFLTGDAQPSRDDLLRIYADDARAAFARKGRRDAEPATITVASNFELPPVPRPPSPDACPHWRLDVDFVCHDVKFGGSRSGIFAWPDEPAGATLDAMTKVLVAEALSIRGDGPEYVDYTDIVTRTIQPTTEPLTHQP